LLLSLFNHSDKYVPILFDEAGRYNVAEYQRFVLIYPIGHRVATQYLMAAIEGHIPAEHLLHYREANSKLPGHPELGLTPGVKFSSGRLGHMWPLVNGVAMANKDKTVFLLGSDGSQQEGNDAEAARLAVAQNLNIKLLIDDNDVTIAGHPSEYLKGYDLQKTLSGHGLKVLTVQGEDYAALWGALVEVINYQGPAASKCSCSTLMSQTQHRNQLFASVSWLLVLPILKALLMATTWFPSKPLSSTLRLEVTLPALLEISLTILSLRPTHIYTLVRPKNWALTESSSAMLSIWSLIR
jgi:transketolase N-terminal domain/subunit